MDTTFMREVWIPALRSGGYRQTTGQLHLKRYFGAYCCLGIYCELHPIIEFDGSAASYLDTSSFTGIPATFVKVEGWLDGGSVPINFPFEIEDVPHYKRFTDICITKDRLSFIALNDNAKLSFAEIADVAEWYCNETEKNNG